MVVHEVDIGMVMGSNLGRTKLSFLFAHFYVWHECERLEKSLPECAAKGAWKNNHNGP